MNKHTPGPWRITNNGDAIVSDDGGTLIVETGQAYWQNLEAASAGAGHEIAKRHLPEVQANASLIAAAPELLEALKGCHAMLTECAKQHRLDGSGEGHGSMADKHAAIARAAIAKATGE